MADPDMMNIMMMPLTVYQAYKLYPIVLNWLYTLPWAASMSYIIKVNPCFVNVNMHDQEYELIVTMLIGGKEVPHSKNFTYEEMMVAHLGYDSPSTTHQPAHLSGTGVQVHMNSSVFSDASKWQLSLKSPISDITPMASSRHEYEMQEFEQLKKDLGKLSGIVTALDRAKQRDSDLEQFHKGIMQELEPKVEQPKPEEPEEDYYDQVWR